MTTLAEAYVQVSLDWGKIPAQSKTAAAKAGETYGVEFNKTLTTSTTAAAAKTGVSIGEELEKGALVAGTGYGKRFGAALHESAGDYIKTIGATLAGFFAAEKAEEFFRDVISGGEQAQVTLKQTASVIKDTGGAAGVSADHVAELAKAMSSYTGNSADAVQSTENLLLRFTNIRDEVGKDNDIFDRATGAVYDLAAGMNISASSAAKSLGKALNDPVAGMTALTRANVQFTDAQKAQITQLVANNDLLDAQKVILAEVAERFGGAAQAADTPTKQLRADFANLTDELGLKLIPAVNAGASALDKLIGPIEDTGQFLGVIGHEFGALPGPIKAATAAIVAYNLALAAASSEKVYFAVSNLVDVFKAADKSAIALRGGVGIAGVALQAFKSQIAGTDEAMKGLVDVAADAAIGFSVTGGPWGAALGAGVGLLQAFGQANRDAATQVTNLRDSLNAETGAVTANTRALVAKSLLDKGALDAANRLGISTTTVTNAITKQGSALDELRSKLELIERAGTATTGQGSFMDSLAGDADKLLSAINDQAGGVAKARQQWDLLNGPTGSKSLDLFSGLTSAVNSVGQALTAQGKALDADTAAYDKWHDALLAGTEGEIGFRNALRDATAQAAANTAGLFQNKNATAAQNAQADSNLQLVLSSIDAWNQLTPRVQNATGAYEQHRKELIVVAEQFGLNRAAAAALIDKYLEIPKSVMTRLLANDQDAVGKVNHLFGDLFRFDHTTVTARLEVDASDALNTINDALRKIFQVNTTPINPPQHKATGGQVFGPGTSFSDSIPAMLSNREFVEPVSAVDYYGPAFMSAIQHKTFPRPQGFSVGGQAGGLASLATSSGGGGGNDRASQAIKQLQRLIDHFSIGLKETSSDVHDEAASLVKQLRTVFGPDSAIVANMADLGAKMVEAARDRDQVAKQLSDAVSKLHDLEQAQRQYEASTTSAFTANPFGADATSVTGMDRYLADSLRKTTVFANSEHKLIADGLSKSLIRQLVGSGPDAYLKAQALANASPEQLRRFEQLAAQQQAQAKRVGRQSGVDLFTSGIKAAEGVVAGLRKERAHITAELEKYAERAVHAVTRALGDDEPRHHHHAHGGRGGHGGGGHGHGDEARYTVNYENVNVVSVDQLMRKQRAEIHKLAVLAGAV